MKNIICKRKYFLKRKECSFVQHLFRMIKGDTRNFLIMRHIHLTLLTSTSPQDEFNIRTTKEENN